MSRFLIVAGLFLAFILMFMVAGLVLWCLLGLLFACANVDLPSYINYWSCVAAVIVIFYIRIVI